MHTLSHDFQSLFIWVQTSQHASKNCPIMGKSCRIFWGNDGQPYSCSCSCACLIRVWIRTWIDSDHRQRSENKPSKSTYTTVNKQVWQEKRKPFHRPKSSRNSQSFRKEEFTNRNRKGSKTRKKKKTNCTNRKTTNIKKDLSFDKRYIYLPVKRYVLQSLKVLLLLTSSSKCLRNNTGTNGNEERSGNNNNNARVRKSGSVLCWEKPMESDFLLLRLSCQRSYRSYIYGPGVMVGSL
jgi:hypothetical protein